MGDAVNLAARLMAHAPAGEVYATPGVLERSATRFDVKPMAAVHGQGQDASPSRRGRSASPLGSRAREGVAVRFPLVGRDARARRRSSARSPPPARGCGPARRDRRRARHRQDAPRRGAARARRRHDAPAGHLRGLHLRHAVRRLARPAAPARRRRVGGPRHGRRRAPARPPCASSTRSSSRGCRCSPSRSAPTCRRRREVAELAPELPPARACTRCMLRFLRAGSRARR